MSALRFSYAAFLVLGLGTLTVAERAHAATWDGEASNDVNVGTNWTNNVVPDASAALINRDGIFTKDSVNNHNSPSLSADWNPLSVSFDPSIDSTLGASYTLAGSAGTTLKLGLGSASGLDGNIASFAAQIPIIISVPNVSIEGGGGNAYISAETADLTITSSTLKVGAGSNGGTFTLYANQNTQTGNLFITPAVDLAANTVNRPLSLQVFTNRSINLAGGIIGCTTFPTPITKTNLGGTVIIGAGSTNISSTTVSGGALTVTNPTGSATGAGNITIAAATLNIGNGGADGSVDGNISFSNANAIVNFNRTTDLVYNGNMTGTSGSNTGSVNKLNNNKVTLGGNSNNVKTTTVSAGTLEVNGTYAITSSSTGATVALGFAATTPTSVTGSGTITIGTNNNNNPLRWIDMKNSSAPVEVSTANLLFYRGNSGLSGSSDPAGSLTVSSSSLKMGMGGTTSSSKNFIETQVSGGNITISPTVDLSGISANQPLNATAHVNTKITLSNGITGHASFNTNLLVNNDVTEDPSDQTGTVVIGGNSTFLGTTTVANGTLLVNGNLNGSGLATVNSGAVVGGTGTIGGDVQVDGTLAPGKLTPDPVIGTLSQGTTAINNATINGTYLLDTDLAGNSDLFNVTGTLTLGGSSLLDLVASSLNATSTYTIASYTTLGGTFGTVDSDILTTHTVDYLTGNTIRLVPISTGVNGDYNGNGVVDAADYVIWRKNSGLTGPPTPTASQGNGNGDNVVDSLDYDYWRARFGNTSGSGAGGDLTPGGQVPEPATCGLLLLAILGVISRRVSRR